MAGMLAYSFARALVVGETLSQYGVNPWLFLLLDVGSAVPLAWGQVRLVQGLRLRDARLTQRSLLIVAAAFLTPYLYLLFGAGKPLPEVAYWIMATILLAAGAATVWRIRVEARGSAREQNSEVG